MKYLSLLRWAMILTLTFSAMDSFSQGNILSACTSSPNPLDPNNDGYITNNTNGAGGNPGLFTSAANEQSEFELVFRQMPYTGEVNADNSGAACGPADIVFGQYGGANSFAYYALQDPDGIANNGDERYLFRLRLAKQTSGSFGFSVLLDIDEKVGLGADPNAVPGNPGFEIEVRLSKNVGLFIDNVDGTTSATNMATYLGTTHFQIARAADRTNTCGAIANNSYPVFYDFWVPLSALGITSLTPVRMVAASSNSGNSVLSGSASDIGGVDDLINADQDSLLIFVAQSGGSVLLPIELLSLSATQVDDAAVLTWKTASEENSGYFEVQRSADMNSFESLGLVKAAGNSNTLRAYTFTDPFPLGQVSYYRLRMVDVDGAEEYSAPVVLPWTPSTVAGNTRVSPNPVRQGEAIRFTSGGLERLRILDATGRVVFDGRSADDAAITVTTSGFSTGLYMYETHTSDGSRHSGKVIVTR